MASKLPTFPADILEGVADVLGNTDQGLTGSELAHLLAQARVPDVDPGNTKRKRLFNALASRQNGDCAGNCVVAFIVESMAPVRYRDNHAAFLWRQQELDRVLIHAGYRINDEGKVARVSGGKARTIEEAEVRAGVLRTELARRTTHPQVLAFCTPEVLQRNNFHALLEATKGIADRLRTMSGLTADGSELVQGCLSPKSGPLIGINEGHGDSDRSEQSGFANLVVGLMGLYRNPTAHDPKIRREITDLEILEAFTTFSMVHRRLDDATVRPLTD